MDKRIKKSFLLGLGLVALTKDKINSVNKKLMKKGDLNKKEAEKVLKTFLRQAEKGREELIKNVSKEVKNLIKSIPIATKRDLINLEKKIKKKPLKRRNN